RIFLIGGSGSEILLLASQFVVLISS
ncbi:hypothetical protein A2U01_0097649, partial [Trifolium medium]|nr:hypothetical protein [Trifolium medium]